MSAAGAVSAAGSSTLFFAGDADFCSACPDCSAERIEKIVNAEMEKHAHGPLHTELAIKARDCGSCIAEGQDSEFRAVIAEREEPVLSASLQKASNDDESHREHIEEALARKRAAMIERAETLKHAQGLLEDEPSINSRDAAYIREGKRATMIREAEMAKHAHGSLQDERAIKAAHMAVL